LFIVDLLQEPELVANVRSAEKDQTDEETGKIMFLLNQPCLNGFSAQYFILFDLHCLSAFLEVDISLFVYIFAQCGS
jgi:hypothetical protein